MRDLGDGRWIRAAVAPQGGWWLSIMEGSEAVVRTRLRADDYRRVCHGKLATQGEVEIRGMRTEVEFRLSGRVLGRLSKASFAALVEAAEVGRDSQEQDGKSAPPESPSRGKEID